MKYSLSFMDIEGMSDTLYFESLSDLGSYLSREKENFLLTATINKIR